MTDTNTLESLHKSKLVAGKLLLLTAAWSMAVVIIANVWRPGKGDVPLSEWGIILWWLASSVYLPLAILGASQYKIDVWKRSEKHKTYAWAGNLAVSAAWIALALMVGWFTSIALFLSHGDIGPNSEWVPDPDMLLSSRTSFFCSFESLAILVSLSSGIFADPASKGTGRQTKAAG